MVQIRTKSPYVIEKSPNQVNIHTENINFPCTHSMLSVITRPIIKDIQCS